ncbi:MAG: hypothetical protein A2504_15470 [Bdellovibrionales bacterium RIFOXYD12_FULL_39_22]|nr:MAG: hypothetical protein A2385_02900 [Bdellovibrionales bacterium RIFOXYB1_FULL_39_21]OFZ43194.1 MAG: hypothetical protein A2485_12045 [Bdellovibrionales bacterium RIFOXYC12_FULL_39_17]OFZ47932.1 MAG: hypothetical protein A2404_16685 [Bdellovibrionales bacterium RIFOXYC1_FULL_39_130]OFZ74850.1 MAG: hypothetical protein A2451_03225 [Bdellovibrionales bacterium RIFOXYC2_FULL_39_8]OFZ75712.1 MAG: hypothetical protein A2560_13185 [Bdellovibrionales bacterium RIFOXYD1_FULL_39_84]OFZ94202.1 MAG:
MKLRSITTSSLLIAILIAISYNPAGQAKENTPDFWRCNERVSGSWVFGRAPYACDASTFMDLSYIAKTYPGMEFSELVNTTTETARYMNNLYTVIRDVAQYYLTKRKPNVSNEELAAWTHAIFAVAHQESLWSHYRLASDRKLKFMRGDVGHGHGLMQVDDRWHFLAINNGTASGLVSNMIYSLEEYFSAWQVAPSKSCVGRPDNYKARTRSAWSAYNGGPAKICRWANPNDTYASHDRQFLEKYTSKAWENYITDTEARAPIDVVCIAEMNENCELPGEVTPPEEEDSTPQSNRFYQTAEGHYCAFAADKFHCLSEQKNLVCMEEFIGHKFDTSTHTMPEDFASRYPFIDYDLHDLCTKEINSLATVGSAIKLNKSINLRATAAGEMVTTIPAGTIVQVLDSIVRNYQLQDRYYYVKYNKNLGYIYAGNSEDAANWSQQTNSIPNSKVVARSGELLATTLLETKLYASIGGELIDTLPSGHDFTVNKVVTRGPQNSIYFYVEDEGSTGYIYAGTIFPQISMIPFSASSSISPDENTETKRGALKTSIWYRYMLSCPASSCARLPTAVWGKIFTNHFTIIDETENMYQVKLDKNGETGWLKKSDVREL